MTAEPAENYDDENLETEGDDAPYAAPAGEQPADTPEARARALGWTPKEEFKGDPKKWISAEDFLKWSENDIPRLRRMNHHLTNKVDKLEKGIEQILAHQERELETTRKKAYEAAMADLKRQHAQAVEDGDVGKAAKAAAGMTSLAEQQVREANAQPKPGTNTDDETIVSNWIAQNKWYDEHPDLRNIAAAKENDLARRGVGLAERLKQTADYMRQRYPNEVGGAQPTPRNGRDPAPAMVNGSRRNGTFNGGHKPKYGTYDALTAEAKQQCDRVVKASNGKITKETWCSNAIGVTELWQYKPQQGE